MNYIDVYFARRNHMGETTAEVAHNSGERSFDRWLKDSPHTVWDLSVERGLYFPGLILSQKDEVGRKSLTLNISCSVPVEVGDIMNWKNGQEVEKWLIYKKERKVNEYYQVFQIIKCNYLIKWVDEDGIIQSCWAYFASSLDSKVKENFRTWNSLITPQPNKYAEIIMPRRKVNRQTKFILEDEAWYVIEYDHTSVQGVIYLSLSEDKVNPFYDDRINNIADLDTAAHYEIVSSDNIQSFKVGQEINPIFYIMKNGAVVQEEYEITSRDKKIAKEVKGVLTAVKAGEVILDVQLKRFPSITMEYKINVSASNDFAAFIEGNVIIKLNHESSYKIVSNGNANKKFNFSIDNEDLVKIVQEGENECTLKANDKNKLGYALLTATCGDIKLTKDIRIIPLW